MNKSLDKGSPATEKSSGNKLYVASVNRALIIQDMGEQYACRNVDTPDYNDAEDADSWIPAELTPEQERLLFSEYY